LQIAAPGRKIGPERPVIRWLLVEKFTGGLRYGG
jgi:hypothetical protein